MRPLDPTVSQMLRALVRKRTAGGAESFAHLARMVHNWDDVFARAAEHGILPALHARLLEIKEAISSDVLDRARRKFERNAFHCMTNAEELLDLLRVFEGAGIEALPFKGVVFGASAYGDMTLRNAGDIDLLIRYRDLQHAAAILRQRGYELKTKTREDGSPENPNYFEYHFERPSDGMVLELRWKLELTQPRYRCDLGLDWVWHRRRTVQLAGADVQTLDPIRNLLVLCMHGTKHRWSRLMWVCDVARAIESEPSMDWPEVCEEARSVSLLRPLALGVMLANLMAGADVPAEVLAQFEKIGPMRKLAAFFSEHLVTEPGKLPTARVPYNIQILGFRDRAASVLSLEFLKPNPQDRALIKLPKSLDALYYLVRPIRILLDRSGR